MSTACTWPRRRWDGRSCFGPLEKSFLLWPLKWALDSRPTGMIIAKWIALFVPSVAIFPSLESGLSNMCAFCRALLAVQNVRNESGPVGTANVTFITTDQYPYYIRLQMQSNQKLAWFRRTIRFLLVHPRMSILLLRDLLPIYAGVRHEWDILSDFVIVKSKFA